MIKVVYVGGNFSVSYATENHLAVSFEAAGCEVVRVKEQGITRDRLLATLEKHEPDLLLWTRVFPVDPTIGDVLASPPGDIVTAAAHLDVFMTLARQDEIQQHPMWRSQHVFTPDGDATRAMWARLGVNHHWLPPAVVDPALVGEKVPGTVSRRWAGYDVAFVGSRGYHGEWPFRPALIDRLRSEFGDRFAHVGGDGNVRGRGGGAMREQELDNFYATVPVAIGDSCFAHPETVYVSDRWYEGWGRGGFQVFPRIEWLAREFDEYPWYEPGDVDSAIDAVRFWLAQPQEERDACRDKIGGQIRSAETYTDRARSILRTLGLE